MHELLLLFIIIKRKYYQKGLFIDIPCRSWLGFDLYSIYLFIALLSLFWFGFTRKRFLQNSELLVRRVA